MFKHEPIDLGYSDLKTKNEDGKRKYITATGELYPSVTTVLSILSEKSIQAWRRRVGPEVANKISTQASRRGTSVHTIIEKYINNEENYREGVTPDVLETFLSVKKTLDERIGVVYGQELPLYSDHLRLAGRVDCVAEFDGKISIIDFKTSRKWKKRAFVENYFAQEAAYAIMWEERTGMPITQLVTLIAGDEGEQIFIEKRDDHTQKLINTISLFEERQNR
jgi:genome maintenance exonuclease 1